MEQTLINLFSEFGVISTLLIILILSMIYYAPKMFSAHFTSLKEMQADFKETLGFITNTNSINLDKITSRNKDISDGFLKSIEKLGHEHEIQMKILEKIDKTQDLIHNKVK